MLDPSTLTTLASATVALLSPLIGKAFEKGAEEAGKGAAGLLVERLKTRLGSTRAKDALADVAQQPADADSQAALRVQLKKAVEAEPALADFLQQWLEEARKQAAVTGITQTATVTGNHNQTVQIAGSGNSVG
ncbi:hypothetical protein SAMN05216303_107318 [Rhodoferax sp. OV413]|uniref:hypothetical protein n=1 Tax=Rhodoferax sp. OV413 TaxID=1855285 RepID=UPI000889EAB1|nr:hypothetical protein [Rhodoferax sp. OV413]SDP83344.1 hypothetical protein SAMN05216303_107318 [Rhodoferax sp. OV413]